MNPKPDELLEDCLTVADIAQKLKLGKDTVRRMFEHEEGVLRIGNGTRLVGRKYRRHYFTLRVPVSVFLRVRDRLMSAHRRA